VEGLLQALNGRFLCFALIFSGLPQNPCRFDPIYYQLVGRSTRSIYQALKQEAPPPPRQRSRSSSVVDPYLPYLGLRWNQGCHNTALLYEEIVVEGYTGSQRTDREAASGISPNARTSRLERDHHPRQSPFSPRLCASDGEVCPKPHKRANGLFGATHPERCDRRCGVQACAGLWLEARESARGRCVWSNGKPLFRPVGLRT